MAEKTREERIKELLADQAFVKFYEWVMLREDKSVSNNPKDPGKQTCWGISRKYWPNHKVWKLVDAGKTDAATLNPIVMEFYAEMLLPYWSIMKPKLREAFCDAYVNMGAGRAGDSNLDAVELLQISLNRLAGTAYVKVDGDLGPMTAFALKTENHVALAYTMCALRYSEYRKRGVGAMAWAKEGWLNRVGLLMDYLEHC